MKKLTLRVKRSYPHLLIGVLDVLERARRYSARSVNVIMTATYWEIGRLIVEHEQQGHKRASYGDFLLKKLASDLITRYGRGFSRTNLQQMREFYLSWPIRQTLSGKLASPLSSRDAPVNPQPIPMKLETEHLLASKDRKRQTASGKSSAAEERSSPRFPLPWSHYVRLLSVKSEEARGFYEIEALRRGLVSSATRSTDYDTVLRTHCALSEQSCFEEEGTAHPAGGPTDGRRRNQGPHGSGVSWTER